MTTPPPEDFPGLAAEERDRRRVADPAVPIDERIRITLEWSSCWEWAGELAVSVDDLDFRQRATAIYADRATWWLDACRYLEPELDRTEGD